MEDEDSEFKGVKDFFKSEKLDASKVTWLNREDSKLLEAAIAYPTVRP